MIRLNVAPIFTEHAEEIAADMRRMYQENMIDSAVFSCALCPEGNPPVDKGSEYARRFTMYKELLKGSGLPIGILIQSTMGHGWTPNKATPWGKIVRGDGKSQYTFCPEDKDFRAYVFDAVAKCAKAEPDFFMLDDDTRLISGRNACFCPTHVELFNKQFGTSYQPDELRELAKGDKAIRNQYLDMLRISMKGYAQVVRDAIDSVNPKLFCSFCQCCWDTYATPDMARVLAGKGHRPMVRINNGLYKNDSARTIPGWLMRTAEQILTLPEDFTIIAEPDTCPQNRYSTSAAFMRTHLTLSMMEGCKGGKLWITRMGYYEPESGKMYRKALHDDAGLMQVACDSVIDWRGPQLPIPSTPCNYLNYDAWDKAGWFDAFARMGLPFGFSRGIKKGFVTLMSEKEVENCTDEELKAAFSGKVLLDGFGALALTKRGLAEYCGCKAVEWSKDQRPSGERWGTRPVGLGLDNKIVELIPDKDTKVLSVCLAKTFALDNNAKELAPASVMATNSLGGTVITYAMQCKDDHGFSTAFSTMNETRKAQFIEYLNMLEPLELYFLGDNEVMLKYGVDQDGRRIAEFLNIGLDPQEEITLKGTWTETTLNPQVLQQDGTWKDADYTVKDGLLTINAMTLPSRVTIFSL